MNQVNRIDSGGVGKVANEREGKVICVLGYINTLEPTNQPTPKYPPGTYFPS